MSKNSFCGSFSLPPRISPNLSRLKFCQHVPKSYAPLQPRVAPRHRLRTLLKIGRNSHALRPYNLSTTPDIGHANYIRGLAKRGAPISSTNYTWFCRVWFDDMDEALEVSLVEKLQHFVPRDFVLFTPNF